MRLNVYAGKAKADDGSIVYQNMSVTLLGDQAIMARADFAEKNLGNGMVLRKKAAFRCGAIRIYYILSECPICCMNMQFKIKSGRMVCPGCGAEINLDEKDKRKSVYAFEYIITEERKVRKTA